MIVSKTGLNFYQDFRLEVFVWKSNAKTITLMGSNRVGVENPYSSLFVLTFGSSRRSNTTYGPIQLRLIA